MTVHVKDSFDVVNELMQRRFAQHADKQLYTTDVTDLDETYLAGFDDPAERQYHNCNACRRFIRNFGSLVYIDSQGVAQSPFWDIDLQQVPEEFRRSVELMDTRVTHSNVTGMFISAEAKLGLPKNWSPTHQHDWYHFNVILPATRVHRDRLRTAGQVAAERLQEFGMLQRSVGKYSVDVLMQAEALLKSDAALRSDKFLAPLRKFKALIESRRTDSNRLWQVVATDTSLARFGQSVVGTLLDDIADGKTLEAAKHAFLEKIDPLRYQRAQVAPKLGNLKQAEDIVAKLGVAASLKRSVAEFNEVGGLAWLPRSLPQRTTASTLDVFANLVKPAQPKTPNYKRLPGQTMTWLKFANEVLSTAESILYTVPATAKPYFSVTKATDGTAPVIFNWGSNFSGYRWAGGQRPDDVNLTANSEVKVRGIGTLPHMWTSSGVSKFQPGAVIYLEGAHDLDIDKAGVGLYAECLIPELYSVRSSVEALSKAGVLTEAQDPACGLRITKGEAIGIKLSVVTGNIITEYTVDRWD